MKASVWNSIGDYSQSLNVEFNSESDADCVQAEKYIMTLISARAGVETEVTDDVNGQSAPVDG